MTPDNRPTAQKSVDPQEIARFERLAESWWDPTGPFWPLHRLNSFRVAYLTPIIVRHFALIGPGSQPLQGLRGLDIGCGGGLLSESLAGLGARVLGIDVVERNIRIAQEHAVRSGLEIDYRWTSAEHLATQGTSFDLVMNMEVVEHVADLPAFLATCAALVRPGGLMVVATINRTAISWLFAILGAEYILRWLSKGTHQWRKFRRPEEILRPLAPFGFRTIDQTGVRINPFTRGFRPSPLLGVNYMLCLHRQPD